MRNLVGRLEKRGWSNKEISRAVKIIQNAKRNKTKENLFLEKRIYWILLMVIIVANFSISIALIPLLIAFKGILLYFLIIILGITFGLLFELVIRSIEHFERKHHIILAFLIPLIALMNAFIISKMSNVVISQFGLGNFHEPFVIGLVYAASFVLPYIVYRFVLKIEYYAKE